SSIKGNPDSGSSPMGPDSDKADQGVERTREPRPFRKTLLSLSCDFVLQSSEPITQSLPLLFPSSSQYSLLVRLCLLLECCFYPLQCFFPAPESIVQLRVFHRLQHLLEGWSRPKAKLDQGVAGDQRWRPDLLRTQWLQAVFGEAPQLQIAMAPQAIKAVQFQ